jgi:hypothetical protein
VRRAIHLLFLLRSSTMLSTLFLWFFSSNYSCPRHDTAARGPAWRRRGRGHNEMPPSLAIFDRPVSVDGFLLRDLLYVALCGKESSFHTGGSPTGPAHEDTNRHRTCTVAQKNICGCRDSNTGSNAIHNVLQQAELAVVSDQMVASNVKN